EMDLDSLSTKENHSDAKWVCRTKIYDKQDAKERWPDGEFEAPDDRKDSSEPIDIIAAAFYRSDSGAGGRADHDVNKVIIHDFQWWEHETVYRIPAQYITPPIAHILLKGYALDAEPQDDNAPYVNPYELKPDSNGLITLREDAWSRLKSESGLPKEVFNDA